MNLKSRAIIADDRLVLIGRAAVVVICLLIAGCAQQSVSAPGGADQSFKPSKQSAKAVIEDIGKNWESRQPDGSTTNSVRAVVELDPHFSVVSVSLETSDIERYKTDPEFRNAFDAAKRAVMKASPLPLTPEEFTPATYDKWHFISIAFYPKDLK